jgi:hypothetical protein
MRPAVRVRVADACGPSRRRLRSESQTPAVRVADACGPSRRRLRSESQTVAAKGARGPEARGGRGHPALEIRETPRTTKGRLRAIGLRGQGMALRLVGRCRPGYRRPRGRVPSARLASGARPRGVSPCAVLRWCLRRPRGDRAACPAARPCIAAAVCARPGRPPATGTHASSGRHPIPPLPSVQDGHPCCGEPPPPLRLAISQIHRTR